MIGYPINWIIEMFLMESGARLGEIIPVYVVAKNMIGIGIDHKK